MKNNKERKRDLFNILCFIVMCLLWAMAIVWDNSALFVGLNILAIMYFAFDIFNFCTRIRPCRGRTLLLLHHILALVLIGCLKLDVTLRLYFLLDFGAELNSIFLIWRKTSESRWVEWGHSITWYFLRLGCTIINFGIGLRRLIIGYHPWVPQSVTLIVSQGLLLCLQLYWHTTFYLPGKKSLLSV